MSYVASLESSLMGIMQVSSGCYQVLPLSENLPGRERRDRLARSACFKCATREWIPTLAGRGWLA